MVKGVKAVSESEIPLLSESHVVASTDGATSSADPTGVMNKFQKGVAISVWQNSGDGDSNWARYAKSRWPFRSFGISAIRGMHNIDTNSDFWNRCAMLENHI